MKFKLLNLKVLKFIVLMLPLFSFYNHGGNFEKRYDSISVDPSTTLAITQATMQIWQAFGNQDKTFQQMIEMLQIIDEKLNIVNRKMDIVIEQLNNVDERTYKFFKTSEGDVLLKNISTFERALYSELQDVPSSQLDLVRTNYILSQQERLNNYLQRLHDIFLSLEQFGDRPEIASYISVSFLMENRIYKYLIEANAEIIPKSLMKSRQDNYLKYFAKTIPMINQKLNQLNTNFQNDINEISDSLNADYQTNGTWIRKARGYEYVKDRTTSTRDGPKTTGYVVRISTFTLHRTAKFPSEHLDSLKNELGYNVADWFYGFGLNVTTSHINKNVGKKHGLPLHRLNHDFNSPIINQINSQLPRIFENSRNELTSVIYSIENIYHSLFTIEKNEINQIFN